MLSIFDQGPHRDCPEPFNLTAYVLQHSSRLADKTALEIADQNDHQIWSYDRFSRAVYGLAGGLRQRGLKPGDILLMRLGNTVDFPLVFLASIAAGVIPVPTSAALREREVTKIIKDLSPAAIVRDPFVSCPKTGIEIPVSLLPSLRSCAPIEAEFGDPERLAYIVYTSGTSGHPRAVGHAHRAIWARQMMIRDWYAMTEGDRMMHAGAFNWTFTLGTGLMDPLTVGATAIIPANGSRITDLPHLMRTASPSLFAAAPGVYRHLLKSEENLYFPSLRHCLSAGEKLPQSTRTEWSNRSHTGIFEAFGMSECSTFISQSPHSNDSPSGIGRPQNGRRVAILGSDNPEQLGVRGVIAIHREDPGLMLGYVNAPEDSHARFQGEWFLTGDHGLMGEDGQITYLGRADDMMNAGGFRVSPHEVEAAFADCPLPIELAVAEIELREGVSIIAGFYKLTSPGPDEPNNDIDVSEQMLLAFAQERLADYKQPKTYIRVDELPTGPNGKLLRRALPALFTKPMP